MIQNVLTSPSVFEKLKHLKAQADSVLNNSYTDELLSIPSLVARDVEILPLKQHPDKKGLSIKEGQARMLHDLASIELQAMELALRTLIEFNDYLNTEVSNQLKEQFQKELYDLTISEGNHLEMCIQGIEALGYKWGDWPVHTALWEAVSTEDSLLDRILIVHRYLEGSGLDAGDTLIRRLNGVSNWGALSIVKTINYEEIEHVCFGSKWYREFCFQQNLDPDLDFKRRIQVLRHKLPKRVEKINKELRRKAGFNDNELEVCEQLRQSYLTSKKEFSGKL